MDNSTRPKTRLRWYQFHLRTLLVFVLVAGMLLGWLGICLNRARQQRAAVIRIRELGGEVAYEAVSFPGSTLLHKIAGEDMAAHVLGESLGWPCCVTLSGGDFPRPTSPTQGWSA